MRTDRFDHRGRRHYHYKCDQCQKPSPPFADQTTPPQTPDKADKLARTQGWVGRGDSWFCVKHDLIRQAGPDFHVAQSKSKELRDYLGQRGVKVEDLDPTLATDNEDGTPQNVIRFAAGTDMGLVRKLVEEWQPNDSIPAVGYVISGQGVSVSDQEKEIESFVGKMKLKGETSYIIFHWFRDGAETNKQSPPEQLRDMIGQTSQEDCLFAAIISYEALPPDAQSRARKAGVQTVVAGPAG